MYGRVQTYASNLEYDTSKTHKHICFCKEVKTIIVVDVYNNISVRMSLCLFVCVSVTLSEDLSILKSVVMVNIQ